jgi:hypothetical protein|tara:strand:+ start:4309 stop:4518 length:210 start_codon:yes stop_codon:yes gene_type:complete
VAQVIKIKRSETSGAAPTSSDLATHELAMNPTDKKIYTKNANGDIIIVASHSEAIATEDDILALSIALG